MGEEQKNSQNTNRTRRRRRRRSNNNNNNQNSNNQNSNNNNNNNNNSNNSQNNNNRSRKNHGQNNNNNRSRNRQSAYSPKTPKNKFGGRDPVTSHDEMDRHNPSLTPFDLFCLYHLGITDKNGFKTPNARDCARRLRVSMDEMHDALRLYCLDNKSFDDYDFDLNIARLDIRVAPEGIDRREIAKVHFAELLEFNDSLDVHLKKLEADRLAEEKAKEEAAAQAQEDEPVEEEATEEPVEEAVAG